jgi:hypothetical protein
MLKEIDYKEISITRNIRVTLQEFDDHIYLRNIGGHEILPCLLAYPSTGSTSSGSSKTLIFISICSSW